MHPPIAVRRRRMHGMAGRHRAARFVFLDQKIQLTQPDVAVGSAR
jgi:hypothetical protein